MGKISVGQTLSELQSKVASLRCSEVCTYLAQLGYVVLNRKKAGHKVFNHPDIADWAGSNFACGHGRDGVVKPAYVRNIIRVLNDHKKRLESLRGETSAEQ
jgi:predicted RNA binding protein YcfA (HicA-like mRNA interferase family)